MHIDDASIAEGASTADLTNATVTSSGPNDTDAAPVLDEGAPVELTEGFSDAVVETETTAPLSLEERVAALETQQAQLLLAIAETSKSTGMIGAQFGGIQQNLGQMVNVVNQLAQRVNAMDPNRPILEVTFCQYPPVLDSAEKGAVFKITKHNETHPEKPNQIDALRLDLTNPEDPHYVPVGISAPLLEYLQSELTTAGISPDTWVWVRVREIKRPTGVDVNFQMGEDDSTPPAEAANDDAAADAADGEVNDTDAAPIDAAISADAGLMAAAAVAEEAGSSDTTAQ